MFKLFPAATVDLRIRSLLVNERKKNKIKGRNGKKKRRKKETEEKEGNEEMRKETYLQRDRTEQAWLKDEVHKIISFIKKKRKKNEGNQRRMKK